MLFLLRHLVLFFQDDCIPDSCLAGNSRQLEAVFFIEAVFQKAVIDEA